MEDINNEIKLLEKKVINLSDKIEELTGLIHKLVAGLDQSDEIVTSIDTKSEDIEKSIEEIIVENEEKSQALMSQTVKLMQQTTNSDQDAAICEQNMKACKTIEGMVHSSKEMYDRQKTLLQMWQQHIN